MTLKMSKKNLKKFIVTPIIFKLIILWIDINIIFCLNFKKLFEIFWILKIGFNFSKI